MLVVLGKTIVKTEVYSGFKTFYTVVRTFFDHHGGYYRTLTCPWPPCIEGGYCFVDKRVMRNALGAITYHLWGLAESRKAGKVPALVLFFERFEISQNF